MGKKRPRFGLKTLQLSKPDGGHNLLKFKYFFLAAQMKYLVTWMWDDSNTRWLNIERNMCPGHLQTLPFSDTSTKELAEWTKIILKIWRKIQAVLALPKIISPLIDIGFMKSFKHNDLDISLRKWSDHILAYLLCMSYLMMEILRHSNSWKMNLTSLGQFFWVICSQELSLQLTKSEEKS